MASRHEVCWVDKNEWLNPHERILAIGGAHPDGTRWQLSQKEAIEEIKRGEHAFYVRREGREMNVVVARSHFGYDYLKAEADTAMPAHLLSLPGQPVRQ